MHIHTKIGRKIICHYAWIVNNIHWYHSDICCKLQILANSITHVMICDISFHDMFIHSPIKCHDPHKIIYPAVYLYSQDYLQCKCI